MADPVELILRFAYWYGRALGVVNFEVEWRTGKARITRRATIYAAAHHVILISLLYMQKINDGSMRLAWANARFLHEYFFLLMTVVRHWAVLFTLVSRWRQRRHILRLWNQLVRMLRERPEVMRLYRRAIVLKFVFGFLSDSMHTVLDFSAQRKSLSVGLAVNLCVWYTFSTIFNMVVAQYFLAILQVHGHYIILCRDLEKLVGEASSICGIRNRRGGVFATKCCSLADELEALAKRQSNLQGILFEMWNMFQIQTLSMSIVYYLSTMGTIYYAFCSVLYNTTGLGSSSLGLLLIAVSTAFFYADNYITLNIGFLTRDHLVEVHRVLAERTSFCHGLDERLETAFDSFLLQLARNPSEFYIFGLYKVERGTIMGMINSVIIHSILLVQWELQSNNL